MSPTSQFLIRHGLPLIFAAVFVEQMGLPLPALPWLLAAGALSAVGEFSFALGLLVAVVACLIADAIWFYLGRYRGNQVLGLLCRISLEPDSCVRRTQNVFTKYGLRGVLLAKFLPGMSTVAPPVAGMSKISAGRFLFVDGIGSALYAGCVLGLGFFFNRQIDQILAAVSRIGGSALSLLVGLAVLFIAYKYWQRQRLLYELRMARITASELREMLQAGQSPLIFDLRSSTALEEDPVVIQGAVHVGAEEFDSRLSELPKDRDIIVYCSCPNEISSARLALRLKRKGFT
ncbi:MAG: VTT domain-containing protein, partial [Limisphaerales bacterium]